MSVVVPHENLAEDFDDELEDRDQYFVQKLVEEFEDEPSILHNEYPETESDSEEEAEEGEPLVGRQRTPHIRRGDGPDGHLYKDQTFFNGVAFKEAVLDYALKSKRNLKQYRHIYGNLKKKHPSKKHMKPYIWNLAWSYNEPEFLENLDRLFNYDSGVYNDVMKQNPRSWCRAFYKKGNYCEDVENNSTESFNKTIKQARGKAFVPMLETIRRLAMARIAKRSAKSHGHNGICTPYVAKFLEKEHEEASKCIVTAATNGYYEAKLDGCPYRVNLDRRTCSCHKFEICGIPCKHAYGVIMVKVKVPEDYVCHWFRTATWKRNYEEGPIPVRGIKFWPTTGAPKVHPPPVPDKSEDKSKDPSVDQLVDQSKSKKTTKADHKRKRGVNESPTKKAPKLKKRIMHCGVCGDANHNSRKHKNDSNKGQGEASQANLTQAESSQGTLTQAPSSQAT
ncbi:unnamed protein product [Microthlaspi erraticum]|uniref:SWIM-type domain-containing protein n=1 Tax=Microthlaspi erraticum TaxID=1685480 RepID=A0A6D2K4Z9_9BRAS|nr:unnamed protein product [Microthlaspi erraticum]